MKGQQEVIAPILMVGVFLALIGSIYFWGLPLIEKNKGMVYLEKAEAMMRSVPAKIKAVAAGGGRDFFIFDLPDVIRFNSTEKGGSIVFFVRTEGTVYSPGFSYFFTNNRPGMLVREMGKIDPVLAFVYVSKYKTTYPHTFVIETTPLNYTGGCSYILLAGDPFVGGRGAKVVIEHGGSYEVDDGGIFADYCSGRRTSVTVVNVRKE